MPKRKNKKKRQQQQKNFWPIQKSTPRCKQIEFTHLKVIHHGQDDKRIISDKGIIQLME